MFFPPLLVSLNRLSMGKCVEGEKNVKKSSEKYVEKKKTDKKIGRQIEGKLAKHDVDVIQAGTKKEGGGTINTAKVTERI